MAKKTLDERVAEALNAGGLIAGPLSNETRRLTGQRSIRTSDIALLSQILAARDLKIAPADTTPVPADVVQVPRDVLEDARHEVANPGCDHDGDPYEVDDDLLAKIDKALAAAHA